MKHLALIVAAILTTCYMAKSQNVGIGTATPQTKLHISSAQEPVLTIENTSYLTTDVTNSMYFKTGLSYTGAVKTIGTGTTAARLGLFTFASPLTSFLKERLSITDAGLVGINTTAPTNTLDINGTLRIRGGNPAAGKVLTSDANGIATWADIPSNPEPFVAFKTKGLLNNERFKLTILNWSKLLFNQTAEYNYGFGYQPLAGNFVATYKGLYHFDVKIELENTQFEVHIKLMQKRGNSTWETAYLKNKGWDSEGHSVHQFHTLSINTDIKAEQGDTFWVEVYYYGVSDAYIIPDQRSNWFSAHLIKSL